MNGQVERTGETIIERRPIPLKNPRPEPKTPLLKINKNQKQS